MDFLIVAFVVLPLSLAALIAIKIYERRTSKPFGNPWIDAKPSTGDAGFLCRVRDRKGQVIATAWDVTERRAYWSAWAQADLRIEKEFIREPCYASVVPKTLNRKDQLK